MVYRPPGFSTVAPYFFSDDAEAYVRFLVEGLGGRETMRTMRGDGKIANAQVAIGDSTVMVSDASDRFPATRASYYLYVDDADAATESALGAGGSLVMAVADMPYGDRQSGVADPGGNIWWISQRLVEEPYSP
ncbi:MAG TPA: VOC family protein [Allosphingosinicella sp.]|jgi:PhnB protein